MTGGELIAWEGPANLQRGWETVGGWLVLSLNNLIFIPHRFNFQKDPLLIPVYHIRRVWRCWTRLFGIFPVCPNSFAIEIAGGQEYRFVVFRRSICVAFITALSGLNKQ